MSREALSLPEADSHTGHPNGQSPTVQAGVDVPAVVWTACNFAEARQHPVAFYLLGEGDDAEHRPDVPLTKKTVEQLASALNDDGQFEQLDLVIQSSGGDIHAAYQIMTLLREHMRPDGELVACVPRRAASAAILLCLGADRILLGETGTLSPLDAQIKTGATSAGTPGYTSALHLLKGLDRLREFSLETFNHFAAQLYAENPERSEELLLRSSIDFSKAITGPLLERIDSPNVGYWDQMLKTGEIYAAQLLQTSKLTDESDPEERKKHVGQVVHDLVNKYPSHTMIIDRYQLAHELGLRADLFEEDLRPKVRQFFSCSSETLIMIVYPAGKAAPFDDAPRTSLEDWRKIGEDGQARNVIIDFNGKKFAMRVGLYRPKIIPANPWRDLQTQGRLDGPSSAWSGGLPGASTDTTLPPELRIGAKQERTNDVWPQ